MVGKARAGRGTQSACNRSRRRPAKPIRDSGPSSHKKSECTGAIESVRPLSNESLTMWGRPCTSGSYRIALLIHLYGEFFGSGLPRSHDLDGAIFLMRVQSTSRCASLQDDPRAWPILGRTRARRSMDYSRRPSPERLARRGWVSKTAANSEVVFRLYPSPGRGICPRSAGRRFGS